jgi:agmatine deiminase
MTTSARQSGFYMPAEWTPHERCWMAWPCRQRMWPDIDATRRDYAKVANTIARFEPVSMVLNARDVETARALLDDGVELVEMAIDDSWARDAGPNFLLSDSGQLAGSCWRFNAWGDTYDPYDQDALMGERILAAAEARCFHSALTFEGGAITLDGEGTVITTESCALHTNRNPGWTRHEVEQELLESLGAEKVIWLPGNPDETETNGHVDGMAQYVRPGVVLMENSFDRGHPWYDIFQHNIDTLRGQTDARGRDLQIAYIEDAVEAGDGERFCTSYINSYLANGAVIMPRYGVAADDRARAVYEKLFPQREICQLEIDGIAIGGGGIHCITQQQPVSG